MGNIRRSKVIAIVIVILLLSIVLVAYVSLNPITSGQSRQWNENPTVHQDGPTTLNVTFGKMISPVPINSTSTFIMVDWVANYGPQYLRYSSVRLNMTILYAENVTAPSEDFIEVTFHDHNSDGFISQGDYAIVGNLKPSSGSDYFLHFDCIGYASPMYVNYQYPS